MLAKGVKKGSSKVISLNNRTIMLEWMKIMHLLKSRVNNLVINMCMHEYDYNDDGHNCHQQHGIDINDLKKCVTCMKHGKKIENGIFSNHIIYGTDKLVKAFIFLYNGMLIHVVSPSELLIGTMVPFQKDKIKAHIM